MNKGIGLPLCSWALCFCLMLSAGKAFADPEAAFTEKLEGFRVISVDNLNLQPSLNPTDALWQLFRGSPNENQQSLSLRTTMHGGIAIVDLKIDGVDEPKVRSFFYRAIAEKGRFGWVVTSMGRKHKCGRFGLAVIPVWTSAPCP